jgi:outer membrane protein OmpA-like peptidoglycan-associated protein
MYKTFSVLGVCVLASVASLPAFADPAYKAADIVSRFAPGLGGTRSLCIGSESECAKPVTPPMTDKGFDLVVNFEYNSDNLTKSARANLDEFASALKDPRLGTSAFVVEGHTDGMGGDGFNLELSMRRANAVVKYLEARGVPNAQLEAKGYGKQRLLVPDPMSSSNRRVETRLRSQ